MPEPSATPGPRHLRPPTRRTGGQRALLGLGFTVASLLFLGACAVGYLNFRFGQIERYDVAIDVPPLAGEPRNYLLVGSDSRAGLDADDPDEAQYFEVDGSDPSGGSLRTDTIMLLRVDPDDGEASLLSFPRDLLVTLSDRGDQNRINVAFARGRQVLVDTIRENFGIPVHHYVEIDFVGFMGIVDAVGGVPVYFGEPVRDGYAQLHVPEAGCVTLRGQQALAYVRSRHLEIQNPGTGRWRADPTGDFGRISRQQAFVRRAVSMAVSKGLTNPVVLNELVTTGVRHVGLDPTLSAGEILSLGRSFASFDADELVTYSLPATPFRTSAGASMVRLDERDAEPILNVFRGLGADAVSPRLVDVTVVNGVGTEGLAGEVTAALAAVGFTTSPPDDTDPVARSTVAYASGSEAAALRLARHLSAPVRFVVSAGLEPGEVVLTVGADFTTVHDQPSPTVPELPTTTTTTTSTTTSTTVGSGGGVPSTSPTTAVTTTSTTEPIGYLPGETPPGVDC